MVTLAPLLTEGGGKSFESAMAPGRETAEVAFFMGRSDDRLGLVQGFAVPLATQSHTRQELPSELTPFLIVRQPFEIQEAVISTKDVTTTPEDFRPLLMLKFSNLQNPYGRRKAESSTTKSTNRSSTTSSSALKFQLAFALSSGEFQ